MKLENSILFIYKIYFKWNKMRITCNIWTALKLLECTDRLEIIFIQFRNLRLKSWVFIFLSIHFIPIVNTDINKWNVHRPNLDLIQNLMPNWMGLFCYFVTCPFICIDPFPIVPADCFHTFLMKLKLWPPHPDCNQDDHAISRFRLFVWPTKISWTWIPHVQAQITTHNAAEQQHVFQ